jgi:hypothetical protein
MIIRNGFGFIWFAGCIPGSLLICWHLLSLPVGTLGAKLHLPSVILSHYQIRMVGARDAGDRYLRAGLTLWPLPVSFGLCVQHVLPQCTFNAKLCLHLSCSKVFASAVKHFLLCSKCYYWFRLVCSKSLSQAPAYGKIDSVKSSWWLLWGCWQRPRLPGISSRFACERFWNQRIKTAWNQNVVALLGLWHEENLSHLNVNSSWIPLH